MNEEPTKRELRTLKFQAKNERRKAKRGTSFFSPRAKLARRILNGSYGTEDDVIQNECNG